MKTPTMTEALEGAIEMLRKIAKGATYTTAEFHERLRAYEDALNDQRQLDIQNARRREQIRSMSRELRRPE